jgi:5-methyltetrahydrofolate--homocysteine methyltransferase
MVLNSVFLHECVEAGLDSAIVHAAKILPMSRIPDEQRQVALDLVYDRRRDGYDPLQRMLELFEGVDARSSAQSRAEVLAALPLDERLQRRIVDGERNGLEADLDGRSSESALDIVNGTFVGHEDGRRLSALARCSCRSSQSAEVMKAAVAYLEPHMAKSDTGGKGTSCCHGEGGRPRRRQEPRRHHPDEHGYTVVNLGIKQPVASDPGRAMEPRPTSSAYPACWSVDRRHEGQPLEMNSRGS